MKIDIVSVFPEYFEVMNLSLMGKAQAKGLLEIKAHNLRDWTHDVHHSVDDTPVGGGAGMVMKPEPVFELVEKLQSERPYDEIIYTSPDGIRYDQHEANRLSTLDNLIILCGHYKGIDYRIREHLVTREISIGDYVLTGGELPAMVVADAVVRLIPGALGDEMSNVDESFSTAEDGGLLEYAQYTRPAEFKGEGVPPVLVSGDHAKVDAWRRKNAIERTCRWRPDLIETAWLTPEERAYAQEILDASYSQSEE